MERHPPHPSSMKHEGEHTVTFMGQNVEATTSICVSSLDRYILVLEPNLTLSHCLNKQHPFIHFVTAYSVLGVTGELKLMPATVS